MKIVICDDEPIFAEYLKKRVWNFFHEEHDADFEEISLQIFPDAESLLTSESALDASLFLLDIRLPGISGLDFAEQMRKRNSSVPIIFISSLHDTVYQTFRVSPLRFIRKECINEELPEALAAFVKSCQPKYLHLEKSGISLEIDKIKYAESVGHYLVFHYKEEIVRVRAMISDYATVLQKHGIIQCQRGYLINLSYITHLKGTCIYLKDGNSITLSRTYQKSFQESYMRYQRENMHAIVK